MTLKEVGSLHSLSQVQSVTIQIRTNLRWDSSLLHCMDIDAIPETVSVTEAAGSIEYCVNSGITGGTNTFLSLTLEIKDGKAGNTSQNSISIINITF